ncbi:MAG: Na/Pi cotransporter family protein [Bacteriovoracaceae bacterium]|nr:Na/Pi cotransporter family protein [Bacteriovoracaceae bacterium]
MNKTFDLYLLIAGLGLFLYGMNLLEDSLKKLAGPNLKKFLKNNTKTPLRGILSGTFITCILQSSSLVSLMVLAFVGAGLMAMENAVGVILGANLGTTITGWIFSLIGFKLNIKAFAFVILGIGAFTNTLFPNKRKVKYFSLTLIGIALLFMGLDFMKSSIAVLAEQFDITQYVSMGPLGFFVVGFILTAIIQSSSASMVITLSALNAKMITFDAAAGMVIGSDLGTTLTVFLGTINASGDKKRVAMSHFLFNLITDLLALILLYPLLSMISLLGVTDPLIGIVLFHTSFNIIGITLFFPFIGHFSRFLKNKFSEKKESYVFYIQNLDKNQTTDMTEEVTTKEVELFIQRTVLLVIHFLKFQKRISLPFELPENSLSPLGTSASYRNLKNAEGEILSFCLGTMASSEIPEESARRLTSLIDSTRRAGNALKNIKDISENVNEIESILDTELQRVYVNISKSMINVLEDVLSLLTETDPLMVKSKANALELKCMSERRVLFDQIYKVITTSDLETSLSSTLLNLVREVFGSFKQLTRSWEMLILGDLEWKDGEPIDSSFFR